MKHLLFVALIAAVCGCAARTAGDEGPHAPSGEPSIRWDSVSLLDDSIMNKIAVEDLGASRTQTESLAVWAVLRNRTDYGQNVEVRTSFYDDGRAPTEEPTAWQRIYITPNGVENYRCLSLTRTASHYYVEVREGR